MDSQQIQKMIYDWACSQGFTAPYGVLEGQHTNANGKSYRAVTFGRARSLDCTVAIYNRSWILVTTNRHGRQVFRNYQDCQAFLDSI